MKALTLHRPWALFVANGEKRIENRPWAPPRAMLGETIAIHAGKKWSEEGHLFCFDVLGAEKTDNAVHCEGIIGTAKIVGWFTLAEGDDARAKTASRLAAKQLEALMLGWPAAAPSDVLLMTDRDLQWCFGPVCWVLREARLLAEPIPCRGFQKLWNVPADIQPKLDESLKARCPTPGCQWGFVHPGDCFE